MPTLAQEYSASRLRLGGYSLLLGVNVPWRGSMYRFDPESFDAARWRASGWRPPLGLERASRRRQAECFHGRKAAFEALAAMGVTCNDLPVASHGGPEWPPGCVGGISHCAGLAVAVVAPQSRLRYLGVDVEHVARGEDLAALRQFTMDALELDLIDAFTDGIDAAALATAVFSAKESLYKAVRADVGRFFDFDAAQVRHIDLHAGLMTLYLTENLGHAFPAGMNFAVRFEHLDESTLLTLLADQARC